MKKLTLMIGTIALISLFSVVSCGEKSKWTAEEKKEFLENCNEELSLSPELDGETYCNCMLEKIMKKYPTPKEAEKITMVETLEWAQDCLGV